MDPRLIIAVITDIKDEEFYELGTYLGKLKALYTRKQITLCKDIILTHSGRGHLNCLNALSRGLNNLNQRLYCVSLNIYNKFDNYFCELKVSGNTHQRP